MNRSDLVWLQDFLKASKAGLRLLESKERADGITYSTADWLRQSIGRAEEILARYEQHEAA